MLGEISIICIFFSMKSEAKEALKDWGHLELEKLGGETLKFTWKTSFFRVKWIESSKNWGRSGHPLCPLAPMAL